MGRNAIMTCKKIYQALLKKQKPGRPISKSTVQACIEKIAGADDRTVSKYTDLLVKFKFVVMNDKKGLVLGDDKEGD